MRRIVRFHPKSNDKNGYDTNTILHGLLSKDDKAQVGTKANVFEGSMFDPDNLKLSGKEETIGKLLIPIDNIPNIYCIGLNYKQHADESKMAYPENPVIFMKPTSTLINPNENILIPTCCQRDEVDYEVELVIVIGKDCKNVSEKEALSYVLGYTVGNDVSARNWQLSKELSGSQWTRGKSFDTFSPLGPCLLIQEQTSKDNNNNNDKKKELFDCNDLKLWCTVNDKKLQDSSTKDFIFNVQKVVSFVSKGTTLKPGTIIFTGTPQGVGFARNPKVYLKKGDTVVVAIANIGQLVNGVDNEPILSNL